MKSKIALFALGCLAFTSCSKKQGMPTGDNKHVVETITSQQAEITTSYPATIRSCQDVNIVAKVSGHILKVFVKEGQEVKAGDPLFLIDPTLYNAAVKSADAAVKVAETSIATQRLNVENKEMLHSKGIISDFDLQSAKNQLATLEAQLSSAKAQLANAKDQLDFCTITSPTDGVIGKINYRQGTLASPSLPQPLTVVTDLREMYVYFSMPEKQVLDLGGQSAALSSFPEVNLRMANGQLFENQGKISAISGVIDANTGSLQVRADFSNPNRLLRSGGTGTIEVPTKDSTAIMVPQIAVVDVQEKKFVYILGEDNKVKYTEIKVLSQNNGQSYIVTEGVKVGDRIVVEGVTTLKDGMEITPITAEERKAIEEKSQQHMAEKKLPGQE